MTAIQPNRPRTHLDDALDAYQAAVDANDANRPLDALRSLSFALELTLPEEDYALYEAIYVEVAIAQRKLNEGKNP